MTRTLSILAVLFVAACCKLQVVAMTGGAFVRKPDPGGGRTGGPGEEAAFAHAAATVVPPFCPPGYCPPGCTDCRMPCPNGDECPPVTCAKVTCDASKLCLYEPAGGDECPYFDGQQRLNAKCATSGLQTARVLDGGATAWTCTPGDCTYVEGKQILGCSVTDPKTITVCTKELYWADQTKCTDNKICSGANCICPCREGESRCIPGRNAISVCRACAWIEESCPNQTTCDANSGICRCSNEGEERCFSEGDPPSLAPYLKDNAILRCTGGQWKNAVSCAPPMTCVSGRCEPPPCGNDTWCPKAGRCVPKCNPQNCEVLNANYQCQSKCPQICNNGSCCFANGLCPAGPGPFTPIIPIGSCR